MPSHEFLRSVKAAPAEQYDGRSDVNIPSIHTFFSQLPTFTLLWSLVVQIRARLYINITSSLPSPQVLKTLDFFLFIAGSNFLSPLQ